MPNTEFDLIKRYFSTGKTSRTDVIVGIGDDGAVLRVPMEKELVVSMDTLVAGIHFAHDSDPESIGHKALAVNLSDIAAMGAEPVWATLSLTLPEVDHHWLNAFSQGFFELADSYNVQLVGGDTCCGPLAITIQLHGLVDKGQCLRRDTAQPGDLIYVTGELGDAGLALSIVDRKDEISPQDFAHLSGRLNRPSPRVKEGRHLQGIANAVIDVSDGLAADLGHILEASHVGATLYIDKIPVSPAFVSCKEMIKHDRNWIDLALSFGDDYELCFTIDPAERDRLQECLLDVRCTWIGEVTATAGLHCILENGDEYMPESAGYDHFRNL